jgi:hypothetical protein
MKIKKSLGGQGRYVLQTWMFAGPGQRPGVLKPSQSLTAIHVPVTLLNGAGMVQEPSVVRKRERGGKNKEI